MFNKNDIQQQSMAAWNQWRPLWIKNCKINRELNTKTFSELLGTGKGKTLVHAAYGHSLSGGLDTIKKNRDKFDLYCCDKAFGYLMENGITPNYCHIADASVKPDWMKGQDTGKTTLIANIAANPAWTMEWKGKIYFYVNWDNIGTAKVLGNIGKCHEVIPASSNVSNAQVVFASQVMGYDKQLLIGYDYSWHEKGSYYAGKDVDKKYWMHHVTVVTPYGYLAKTSTNLIFSCKWLLQFLSKFSNQLIINCSEQGIFDCPNKMKLSNALK